MKITRHENGVQLPAAPWEAVAQKPENQRAVTSKKYGEVAKVDRKAHSQIAVMRALSANGRHTAVIISEASGRGESIVRDVLSRLVKRDWVRVDKIRGGRALYSLTPQGRAALKETDQ